MNKKPSPKAIARFVLLTTPVVGIVLFGIHQMLQPVPTATCYPADPETRTPVQAVKAQPQIAMIDQLLPMPEGISRVAPVKSKKSDNVEHSAGQPDYIRNIVTVEAPNNMSLEEVDQNLRIVAREAFQQGAMSVMVYAFRPGKGMPANIYPVATLIFAPYGNWDTTDRIYNLDEYKTVIRHSSNKVDPTAIEITYTTVVNTPSGK